MRLSQDAREWVGRRAREVPLLVNLMTPLVLALCITTLRSGAQELMREDNCLGGTVLAPHHSRCVSGVRMQRMMTDLGKKRADCARPVSSVQRWHMVRHLGLCCGSESRCGLSFVGRSLLLRLLYDIW